MSQSGEFEELVRECHGELFAVVLSRCPHRESARDLLQDVLLSAWQNRDRLLALPAEGRRRYLFAMARNRAIDAGRQSSRGGTVRSLDSLGEPSAAAPRDTDDRLELLECCMNDLPPDDRELLMLSTLGDLASATIADRLGSNPSTVRSRLTRIRQGLRECITAKLKRAGHVG